MAQPQLLRYRIIRGVHPPIGSDLPTETDPFITDLRHSEVRGGFQTLEIDFSGLVDGFSSLKLNSPNLTVKPRKISTTLSIFQQLFGEISSYQPRSLPDLVEISPNLVKSHQIRQNLAKFGKDLIGFGVFLVVSTLLKV